MIVPAAYGERLPGGGMVCRLCPAHCRFREGRRGICGSRFMRDGELFSDNYGEAVTLAVDPIEKKPLHHFYPGADILSTGPNGCNMRCRHCQNWSISQVEAPTAFIPPERLVEAARRQASLGVAFTYSEPVIWFEYIRDCAPLLRAAGMKTVLVTNGYIDPEPLAELLPLVDAMNIDLKSIRPEFYRRICKGKLGPVLDTIRRATAAGVHVELTNLVIPTLNDSEAEFRDLADFVASVDPFIPMHFSAYHPDYRMTAPPTSTASLRRAFEIASQRIRYVFIGNVEVAGAGDSRCPGCGALLIRRAGYQTSIVGLAGTRCRTCGAETRIVR